ncbi:hypothetical protein ML401_38880 [Bradyrhizobium sp. 62B]|nr:hypothetical protein ML401_38880 [Bradyrhizobium sp. 62B]
MVGAVVQKLAAGLRYSYVMARQFSATSLAATHAGSSRVAEYSFRG